MVVHSEVQTPCSPGTWQALPLMLSSYITGARHSDQGTQQQHGTLVEMKCLQTTQTHF